MIFCRCIFLEKSCKGITGMILKCKDCDRRYKILWDDYNTMIEIRDTRTGGEGC